MGKIREFEFFETDSGRRDAADFIEENIKRRKIRADIMLTLATLETMVQPPATVFKKLKGQGDLWEIRIDALRLLGFHGTPPAFVIVSAFMKQSNKTPLHELEVACRRRSMYLARR